MPSFPKVDVHHHIIPPQLVEMLKTKGMKVHDWTIELDSTFCESLDIKARIFSVPTPGVCYIEDPKESAAIARAMNQYCADLRNQDPQSYGFFATIPSIQYTGLAIGEIRYALEELHADGVALFTSYRGTNQYLGHELFVPVWRYLNERKAVVFVHRIDNGRGAPLSIQGLMAPAFDWPHETGRTAMDMIFHRRIQQFPDVKIILSHAGGTLPALVQRSTLIANPEFGAIMSAEDIMDQAKRFFFDTALSGSKEVLTMTPGFAEEGHVLFGSDFPHAPDDVRKAHTEFLELFEMNEDTRRDLYHGAAEELFPRLKGLF